MRHLILTGIVLVLLLVVKAAAPTNTVVATPPLPPPKIGYTARISVAGLPTTYIDGFQTEFFEIRESTNLSLSFADWTIVAVGRKDINERIVIVDTRTDLPHCSIGANAIDYNQWKAYETLPPSTNSEPWGLLRISR